MGLYPNWDGEAARIISWFIIGALILAWSIWFLSLRSEHNRRLYSWFKLGVCFAFGLGVVRLFLMGDVIKFLHV